MNGKADELEYPVEARTCDDFEDVSGKTFYLSMAKVYDFFAESDVYRIRAES